MAPVELAERFPDANSLESSCFGAEIVDRIQSRDSDASFQEKVKDIVDDLELEQIDKLPKGLRHDMLIPIPP